MHHDYYTFFIRFTCPYDKCSCQMTPAERQEAKQEGVNLKTCPFRRKVVLRDSLGHIQAPLSEIIKNTHISIEKLGVPKEIAFKASKQFCLSKNYDEDQFQTFISQKIVMPYEYCDSATKMQQQKVPPPREAFKSTLRGTTEISEVYTF